MKPITFNGFIGADWIRKNYIVSGEVYTVQDGAVNVDGVRFFFMDPEDTYPDGTEVVVHIFFKRVRNACQLVEEYEEQQRIVEERIREQEEEERKWLEGGSVDIEEN